MPDMRAVPQLQKKQTRLGETREFTGKAFVWRGGALKIPSTSLGMTKGRWRFHQERLPMVDVVYIRWTRKCQPSMSATITAWALNAGTTPEFIT
jgi:hypothetical protein